MKEAIIENATASASGGKSARPIPTMKNDGMNTAITQSIARNFGTITSAMASRIARLTRCSRPRWVCMFSIVTVASSTRMPIARASPPRVMMLTVWPVSRRPTTAARRASGIVTTTINAERQFLRKTSTMSPVSTAPRMPSIRRPRMAFFT